MNILWLSDHPLIPSGVGTQANYVIRSLVKSGKYRVFCLGGAIKHPDYRPQVVAPEEFGDGNWVIQPVNGHGTKEQLREAIRQVKPAAVVLFTDPRFFIWVWEMEDEVRRHCPIFYWHVWDNDPAPEFNRVLYDSTDHVACLSLKTYGLMQALERPKESFSYIPHAEPAELFKPLPREEVDAYRKANFGTFADREFLCMWNNRNARRKMTGDVIESFVRFANRVDPKHQKVGLLMHTDPNDQEGQDVATIVRRLKADDLVFVSAGRVSPEQLNMYYNATDCVLNFSNNEGFGLTTLEGLYAGRLVVVNMTGGLQFQVGNWWEGLEDFSDQDRLTARARTRWEKNVGKWFGAPVFPAVRNLTGSQQCPYIYDDRINDDEASRAIEYVYRMGAAKRRELGAQAREWAMRTFEIGQMERLWDEGLSGCIERWRSTPPKHVRTATIL